MKNVKINDIEELLKKINSYPNNFSWAIKFNLGLTKHFGKDGSQA